MKMLANLSEAVLSFGTPNSLYVSVTFGTENISGIVQAFIFHKINCKAIIACEPPNGPAETVARAMGLCRHSSYNKSMAFFRLAGILPLYSGVTIMIPSADSIFQQIRELGDWVFFDA